MGTGTQKQMKMQTQTRTTGVTTIALLVLRTGELKFKLTSTKCYKHQMLQNLVKNVLSVKKTKLGYDSIFLYIYDILLLFFLLLLLFFLLLLLFFLLFYLFFGLLFFFTNS